MPSVKRENVIAEKHCQRRRIGWLVVVVVVAIGQQTMASGQTRWGAAHGMSAARKTGTIRRCRFVAATKYRIKTYTRRQWDCHRRQ